MVMCTDTKKQLSEYNWIYSEKGWTSLPEESMSPNIMVMGIKLRSMWNVFVRFLNN